MVFYDEYATLPLEALEVLGVLVGDCAGTANTPGRNRTCPGSRLSDHCIVKS